MILRLLCVAIFVALTGFWLPSGVLFSAEPAATGPDTELRFPPLVVPPGFTSTLFACDPLVEYPSVIALGPKPGSLFVAHDYVTGLGFEIVRRDEIRLVEDTDGDGYADKSTLFAGQFNSLQGLAYHDGTVYAMHAPQLTALRDTDGDGQADWRRDLMSGLGLNPEDNRSRLHCANGVVVGHDGWLYLAVGDNGCEVQRVEGDTLVFQQGGILRCRADGSDLHVFCGGLRNIYDVALDHQLNVFVRDNENDGGTYMIRVCHCFHGSDHGYPYHYYERADEAMPPLADLGRGSSAGGVCYLEDAFPKEYRGGLIFCEWGRAVVRYDRKRAGSGFAPTRQIDLAAGAENDPYGFKPTDLVVDRDGSLLISDWADGQRPKRGRARIYRLSYDDETTATAASEPDDLLARLNSQSYHRRVAAQTALERRGAASLPRVRSALRAEELSVPGRLHAVWILAHLAGSEAIDELIRIAQLDSSAAVRAQAVRAIADLSDPVLVQHRLEAPRGDVKLAERLASLADGQPPQVVREIVVALGRLRWCKFPRWLVDHLDVFDPALDHAAIIALRRAGNWAAVVKLLDQPDGAATRGLALRAVAERTEAYLVDQLIARLQNEAQPRRRRQVADLLTRVYKKRPEPRTYWGYRPAPRPANTVTWERTAAIEHALDRVLNDPDRSVRTAVLLRMQRERIPTQLATLANWLHQEREAESVAAIFDALSEHPSQQISALLEGVIREPQYSDANRLAALAMWSAAIEPAQEDRLLRLAVAIQDGPVLAAALRQLGQRAKVASLPLLLTKLASHSGEVRAAAVDALAELNARDAAPQVAALLDDEDIVVRRAAAAAVGRLEVDAAVDRLLLFCRDGDPQLRSISLTSLGELRSDKGVAAAVDALNHRQTQLAALDYLAQFGGPHEAAAVVEVAGRDQSNEVLASVMAALTTWRDSEQADAPRWRRLQSAVAAVQGSSGVLMHWEFQGPIAPHQADESLQRLTSSAAIDFSKLRGPGWQSVLGAGGDARVTLPQTSDAMAESAYVAVSILSVEETAAVQFLASSSGTLDVWLNGKRLYQRRQEATYAPQSDRFEAELAEGVNQIVVRLGVTKSQRPEFHLRARRKSSAAQLERLFTLALTGRGNEQRGREVFLDADKAQCIKCHRMGGQGGSIGPDLTGIGSRFSRVHLIESILQPSRTIAPSYESIALALDDGRVLSGVKMTETESTLTLGDNEGKTHEIAKADIQQQRLLPTSIMPEGLEKRLSDRQFLDLLTFLLAQKKTVPP